MTREEKVKGPDVEEPKREKKRNSGAAKQYPSVSRRTKADGGIFLGSIVRGVGAV